MESAEERRERLKRLREEASAPKDAVPAQSAAPDEPRTMPSVQFRNYKPRDEKFSDKTVRFGGHASAASAKQCADEHAQAQPSHI